MPSRVDTTPCVVMARIANHGLRCGCVINCDGHV